LASRPRSLCHFCFGGFEGVGALPTGSPRHHPSSRYFLS
jgi:hypothetical protein